VVVPGGIHVPGGAEGPSRGIVQARAGTDGATFFRVTSGDQNSARRRQGRRKAILVHAGHKHP